ncbi:MAG: site-2 protease family protein [Candidatus Eisenbacteria bacterium]
MSIHEYAHARVAKLQGDNTAEEFGRVTLNPLAHIDLIGTIVVPLILLVGSGGRIGFGWAKPVPVNPFAMRNPRKGVLLVSLAGPLSNIALAMVAGIVLRIVIAGFAGMPFVEPLSVILISVALINLYLAFFNLIPLPPLDGSGVLSALLPVEQARKYEAIGRFGPLLVIGLIVIGVIGLIIRPPVVFLFGLFTGIGY